MKRSPDFPGIRLIARGRMVNGRLQMFCRLPRSNVPMYALYRFKGAKWNP